MTLEEQRALQDLFEGSHERETALLMLGLVGDRDAERTWDRWQNEIESEGCYRAYDPGSEQGLLSAVFTGIGDCILDDEAWAECCALCEEASPVRTMWGQDQ